MGCSKFHVGIHLTALAPPRIMIHPLYSSCVSKSPVGTSCYSAPVLGVQWLSFKPMAVVRILQMIMGVCYLHFECMDSRGKCLSHGDYFHLTSLAQDFCVFRKWRSKKIQGLHTCGSVEAWQKHGKGRGVQLAPLLFPSSPQPLQSPRPYTNLQQHCYDYHLGFTLSCHQEILS